MYNFCLSFIHFVCCFRLFPKADFKLKYTFTLSEEKAYFKLKYTYTSTEEKAYFKLKYTYTSTVEKAYFKLKYTFTSSEEKAYFKLKYTYISTVEHVNTVNSNLKLMRLMFTNIKVNNDDNINIPDSYQRKVCNKGTVIKGKCAIKGQLSKESVQ